MKPAWLRDTIPELSLFFPPHHLFRPGRAYRAGSSLESGTLPLVKTLTAWDLELQVSTLSYKDDKPQLPGDPALTDLAGLRRRSRDTDVRSRESRTRVAGTLPGCGLFLLSLVLSGPWLTFLRKCLGQAEIVMMRRGRRCFEGQGSLTRRRRC